MKFAYRPVEDCEGMLLGHSIQAGGTRYRKSHWLAADDIAAIASAGVSEIFAGQPDKDDMAENEAAQIIASMVSGPLVCAEKPHTGRCNLVAEEAGLLRYAPGDLIALNLVDERITLAMLPPLSPVQTGDLVGTVKIIPFSVPEATLKQAARTWRTAQPISIAPFQGGKAFLLETVLPSVKPLSDKIVKHTEARIERTGYTLASHDQAPHHPASVTAWLDDMSSKAAENDILLIFGASATVDRADVIPASIEAAGGTLGRVGMAADPGNLLVFGHNQSVPIIGLPGCAKSPALNGFDWVLERTAAQIALTAKDWAGFSVGGLLKEIDARPQLRRPSSGSSA